MNNDTSSKRRDVIAEEAAEYFVALKTPDDKTKAEFIDWLKISPEHVNEFLAVAALWDTLSSTSAEPSPEELVALAASADNVLPLSDCSLFLSEKPATKSSRRRLWLGSIAATVAAVTIVGGVQNLVPPSADPNAYSTAIGEQTSIPLRDGSIVTLNTQSTIRVDFDDASRTVYLDAGEALFEVAKDSNRPFRVVAEQALIRAVGTQFNVRKDMGDVTVTVVEGIVDVSAQSLGRRTSGEVGAAPSAAPGKATTTTIAPVRLTVGQQALIEPLSGQVAVVDAAVERAIAWQQRRLIFEHLSLKEVIDEFNRYNDPPIVIEDPELRHLPISGVFRANDRESFVQFLSQMRLAAAHRRVDGTIMLYEVRDR